MGSPCPPLDAKVVADVCIVGGGFAGLWTAIELSAREPGMRIALLERDICGGGAYDSTNTRMMGESSRSSGVVWPCGP